MPEMYVNQGLRVVEKLAEHDFRVLVQYEMPNGTTALRSITDNAWQEILAGNCNIMPWDYKSVSYGNIPLYWVRALFEADNWLEVYFNPQQITWEKAQEYEEIFLAQIEKVQEQEFARQLEETS